MSRTRRPWALALLAAFLLLASALALFLVRGRPEAPAVPPVPRAAHLPFAPRSATPAPPRDSSPGVRTAGDVADDDDDADDADDRAASGPEAQERAARRSASGLSDGDDTGALVMATPPGSSASVLHLLPGDVIVSANGQPIRSTADFVRYFRDHGQPTTVMVRREGRELSLP